MARVSDRYPYSSRYYKLLFSEKLGYKIIKSFNSYPNLLGVSFVDDTFTRAGIPYPDFIKNAVSSSLSIKLGYADNDVITYDHP
ncbi:MAG: hypothetical protein GWO07_14055, partial [Candidatus Dadabacteria bacterium]|nr:hypothetical protein [Candidatus Dadabacteria bacterium]NIU87566.1 hypothetical protein [Nitrosopumilaceae archaeon]NIX14389.1 hypothetical protein [Candidatus Dadabacteria bacterium]